MPPALDQFWLCSGTLWYVCRVMMTSPNGNIFCVTGPLWGKHRSPVDSLTKASDAELWRFLWSVPEQTVEQTIKSPVIWDAIAFIMTSLWWGVCPSMDKKRLRCIWGPLLLQRSDTVGRMSANTSTVFDESCAPQNESHFADDIFKCIFFNENVWILIKVSLKFVPKGPINNIPSLVQIMACRRTGDKPLSEPMVARSATHICVTRPQWVN